MCLPTPAYLDQIFITRKSITFVQTKIIFLRERKLVSQLLPQKTYSYDYK